MKYLAVIFLVNPGSSESFCLSRETDLNKVKDVHRFMKEEAKASDDSIDTILLVESGTWEHAPPNVVEHWTASGGDFEGL